MCYNDWIPFILKTKGQFAVSQYLKDKEEIALTRSVHGYFFLSLLVDVTLDVSSYCIW